MRHVVRRTNYLLGVVVSAIACELFAAAASAQSGSPVTLPSVQTPGSMIQQIPLPLTGCVTAEDTKTRVTLSGPRGGSMFRLSGKGLDLYAGPRVHIVGGLIPTPNIAAQVGSIDSTIVAMASSKPAQGGRGPVHRREVRVTGIHSVKAPCPTP
jgi:hypothetical protein